MKKTATPAAFAGLFFLCALAAFPQSGFLQKGQYAVGLTGAYAANNAAHGFTGALGFGLGGIFDLRIAFAGDACALGHGAIATGVAYYDSGRLMAVGLLPSQIQGFAFLGGK